MYAAYNHRFDSYSSGYITCYYSDLDRYVTDQDGEEKMIEPDYPCSEDFYHYYYGSRGAEIGVDFTMILDRIDALAKRIEELERIVYKRTS